MAAGCALALSGFLGVAGCAAGGHAARAPTTGSIWDVRAGGYIDPAELAARVLPVRYRLLGEVHDNPAHHALRAELLGALGRSGRQPAVVLEQVDLEHEAALQAAQRAGGDAEALADAGALDRKSWRWPLHQPIMEAALREGMPMHAGNVSRSTLRAFSRTPDLAGLDAPVRARLRRAAWTAAQDAILAGEIRDSHCGKLPSSAVPGIALAQRVRDAAMAEALQRHATRDGAVLLAGHGHVRRDLGVPAYLDAAPEDIVSVGWIETPAWPVPGVDVARRAAAERPGFDYLWFTAPVHRADPCAGMSEDVAPEPRRQASG
jgi:uncharacterized iron-regulated protein